MQYKIDIKIYGIHERDFLIDELKKSLDLKDDDICYDDRLERGSCLYTLAKACTAPTEEGITHRLVMPDDMIVCNDFKIILNKIIHAHPDKVVNLFPFRYDMYSIKARKLTTPYIKSLGGVAGNGIIFPIEYLDVMVDWWKSNYKDTYHTMRSEEALIGFLKIFMIPVIVTIPSIVQHIGDDYGSYINKKAHNRKTVYFKRNCLEGFDWDSKEIVIFPSFKLYRTGADYHIRLPREGLLEEDKIFNPRNYDTKRATSINSK